LYQEYQYLKNYLKDGYDVQNVEGGEDMKVTMETSVAELVIAKE